MQKITELNLWYFLAYMLHIATLNITVCVRVTLQNYQESKDWYCTHRVLYKMKSFSAVFLRKNSERLSHSERVVEKFSFHVKIDSLPILTLSFSLTVFIFFISLWYSEMLYNSQKIIVKKMKIIAVVCLAPSLSVSFSFSHVLCTSTSFGKNLEILNKIIWK